MVLAVKPRLRPGRVYRTRDLSRWSANPTRLAGRLADQGKLVPLAHGLYLSPREGHVGLVPASDEELMRAFLDGGDYVFTGPERWNALSLGTTASFASPLVYNTKRSGTFELGGRRFVLRRVAFPSKPSPEWFVVDLFQHAEQAAASRDDLADALAFALRDGRFDRERLRRMAERYGSKDTQAWISAALEGAAG